MNKLTRVITMGGFGLLTALATSAGPAQAATSSTTVTKSAAGHAQWALDGDQVVGYYRTLRGCEIAGVFGERAGNWDDHDCSPVRIGLRRGAWALSVNSDDDWDRFGFGVPFRAIGSFPTRFRPVWPGQFRGGRPGHFRPGQWGPGRPGGFGNGPRGDHDGPRGDHDGPRGDHDGPRGNNNNNGPRGDHGPRGQH